MPRFYPHPIIAREGWPFISAGLVLSIIVTACAGWWSLPFWLFTAFALQFFRDPSRPIPQDADAVLCPADGRIVVVEKALDSYRNVEALKISVFMNVFNVHSQRAPVDGTITGVEYNKGKFVNAALDKASTENERNAVVIDSNGTTVTQWPRNHLCASGRPRGAPHFVLHRRGRKSGARRALRLYPLRLARGCVSAA